MPNKTDQTYAGYPIQPDKVATNRPRIYLIVNEIPTLPHLTTAFMTTDIRERDQYLETEYGPDHRVTSYELDNIDMHHLWIQSFTEQ